MYSIKLNISFSDETMKTTNEEESSDKHLRTSFGDKWNRTKSEDLTKSFKEQGGKYQVSDVLHLIKYKVRIFAVDGYMYIVCRICHGSH